MASALATAIPNVGARTTLFRAKLRACWSGKLPDGCAAVLTYRDGSVRTVFRRVALNPATLKSVAFVSRNTVSYDAAGRHVGLIVRLDLD